MMKKIRRDNRQKRKLLQLCFVFVLLPALSIQTLASHHTFSQSHRVEGVVKDQNGYPVADAEVSLNGGNFSASNTTDSAGRFFFDSVPSNTGTLTVRAKGFATAGQKWSVGQGDSVQLDIVLAPGLFSEQVTVTATRTQTRVDDTAASVAVLSNETLSSTAAITLDDALRQVPGFTLFRRSGSRTANPTTQGVSLRGVGASGASRAVVLSDLIPLNDPFGGWVYWDRIPRKGHLAE